MVTESPPVSPSVVAAILITQNASVTSGTLLRISSCVVWLTRPRDFLIGRPSADWLCRALMQTRAHDQGFVAGACPRRFIAASLANGRGRMRPTERRADAPP